MTEVGNVLAGWESFYVIVGSSGGALIGLQFVVITLLAERRRLASTGGVDAFATPTVVHFEGALVIAAIMSAPWHSPSTLSLVIGAAGFAGVAYALLVLTRAMRQTSYQPVWEDWVWYVALPAVCYAMLAFAGVMGAMEQTPLFVIAASALGLLLIGIHNAWDTVTHIVLTDAGATDAKGDAPAGSGTKGAAPVAAPTAAPMATDAVPLSVADAPPASPSAPGNEGSSI